MTGLHPNFYSFQYLTAGAIAFSTLIPSVSGQKELFLGRQLWSGIPPEGSHLSHIYGKKFYDKACTSPGTIWLRGHAWDLLHKVFSVAYFHLTSPFTSLQIPNILFKAYHLIIWTPVMLKLIQIALDYFSLQSQKHRPLLKIYCDKVNLIERKIESHWFASPAIVAIDGGMLLWNTAVSTQALCAILVSARALSFNQKINFLRQHPRACASSSFTGLSILISGILHVFARSLGFAIALPKTSSPPSSAEIFSHFKNLTLMTMPITSTLVINKLTEFFKSLDLLQKAKLLSREDIERITVFPREALEIFLQDHVYTPLLKQEVAFLNLHESELRSIYGYQGLAEKLYSNPHEWALERCRLATLLLYANIYRLKLREKDLTAEQIKTIQRHLWAQASYEIQDDFELDHHIKATPRYQSYLNTGGGAPKSLSAYKMQNPYFKPLNHVLKSPEYLNFLSTLKLNEISKHKWSNFNQIVEVAKQEYIRWT